MTRIFSRTPTERWYFGSLRGYSHLFGGFVVSGILTFLSIAVLSRWLKPAGYGQLALFLAVGQSTTYFATFWASSSLLRFGAEECHATGSLRWAFWARASILIPWCAVIGFGLWLTRPFWQSFSNLPQLHAFWTIGFVLALTAAQSIQLSYQAVGQTAYSAVWQALERFAWLAGTIALMLLGAAPSASTVIPVIVSGTVLTAVVSLLLFDRRYWWPPVVVAEEVRRFLTFSWPLIIGQLGGYLTTQWVALAFLRHWHTLQDVGVFQVAYQLMGALQQMVTLTLPITLPLLVRLEQNGDSSGLRRYLTQVVPGLFSLFALGMIAIAFAGAWIIPKAFGSAYASVVEIFAILLVGLGGTALFMGLVPALQLRDENLFVMAGMLLGGITTLAGDWFLIPSLGRVGAALASTFGFLAAAGVVVWRLARRESWPWKRCLPGLLGLWLVGPAISSQGLFRLAAAGLLLVCLWRMALLVMQAWRRLFQPNSVAGSFPATIVEAEVGASHQVR